MRSEQEIRELQKELTRLTVIIGEHGTPEQLHNKDWRFACNACDTLEWVLGKISGDSFTSLDYLKLDQLRHTAIEIHETLGETPTDSR